MDVIAQFLTMWHRVKRVKGSAYQRGKAIRDEYGSSARIRAFWYFNKGLRPSQLPDLGVKPRTIYRYFQWWKHRNREYEWRAFVYGIKRNRVMQKEVAAMLRVTRKQLLQAIKGCRNATQLKRRLGIPGNKHNN